MNTDLSTFFAEFPELTPEERAAIEGHHASICKAAIAIQEHRATVESWLVEMETIGGKEFADGPRRRWEADEEDGGDRLGAALQWMENERPDRLRQGMSLVSEPDRRQPDGPSTGQANSPPGGKPKPSRPLELFKRGYGL
jgi:hypothetical protein